MGTNYCVETATLRWFLRILTDGVTSPGQNVFDIKSGIIITSSIADGFVAIFATIIRKIRKIVSKKKWRNIFDSIDSPQKFRLFSSSKPRFGFKFVARNFDGIKFIKIYFSI